MVFDSLNKSIIKKHHATATYNNQQFHSLIQTDLVQDKFAILKYICLRGALL